MATRISLSKNSPKNPRDLDRGYFYPGQVARMLKLEGVDYRQLRRLFWVIRRQAGSAAPSAGKWARFTFRDLVALRAAIRLAGGVEALGPGRRLRTKDLEDLCGRLRESLDLEDPLSQICLRRIGRTIVARVDGLMFEPLTGQTLISEAVVAIERYFVEYPAVLHGEGQKLREKVKRDAKELRASIPKAKRSRIEVSFR
jgi:hypothetical protein